MDIQKLRKQLEEAERKEDDRLFKEWCVNTESQLNNLIGLDLMTYTGRDSLILFRVIRFEKKEYVGGLHHSYVLKTAGHFRIYTANRSWGGFIVDKGLSRFDFIRKTKGNLIMSKIDWDSISLGDSAWLEDTDFTEFSYKRGEATEPKDKMFFLFNAPDGLYEMCNDMVSLMQRMSFDILHQYRDGIREANKFQWRK